MFDLVGAELVLSKLTLQAAALHSQRVHMLIAELLQLQFLLLRSIESTLQLENLSSVLVGLIFELAVASL